MSDKLLRELGRVARERQRAEARDGRWESLTEGTLSEDERRELERLAQEEPSAAEAYEAFRPLDATAREHIAARLERELAEQTAGGTPLLSREPLAPAREAQSPARQAPRAPRRGLRRLAPAVAAMAAAAALLFVLLPRETPPLPGYSLSVSSEQAVRAGAPAQDVPRLGPGSRLDVLLRPEETVEGAVEVRAFLLRPGEVRAWTPPLERSAEGAVRIRGPVEELLSVPPGEWTLAIAVGRPGTLPEAPEELLAGVEEGRAPQEGPWKLLTQKLLLVDRP
ncbi:hypothetical protein [Pyxidicoccus xibeiensis]|uniref:hypothetical protein n=1 Tax=Pyxidicoccus xibeiensis TaxID=2906759 RepID=UPI0020A7ED31|nr:hypothetical protein [Pyxidicoccus xibeiensis]MCP3137817.1 hypothetical protein [Pyxidicoccus xibeiensis]